MSNAKKNCSGAGCSNRIGIKYPFCGSCFAKIPQNIKSALSAGYRTFDGSILMKAKTDAREFLQKKYDEDMDAMVTGKSDIVEVVLESREVHPGGKAQAFFEGEFIEDRDGNDCEKLIWLPLSQIEVEENRDGTCTVQMPEWLALDKELI